MCWSPRAARAVPGASCLFSPPMMATLPLAALCASLGPWAYGTYEPNSPLFGRVIGRGPGAGRVAYLTFDDGPNPGATEPILDTLAGLGVPAGFFMVGEHVRRFPGIARRVVAAGHEVGNHTLRHPKLHSVGPDGSTPSSRERTPSSQTPPVARPAASARRTATAIRS